jgi:hypothetical protein
VSKSTEFTYSVPCEALIEASLPGSARVSIDFIDKCLLFHHRAKTGELLDTEEYMSQEY